MRRLLIVAPLLFPAMVAGFQDRAPAPIPGWHDDLATGLREAAQTGKPLMVVFR